MRRIFLLFGLSLLFCWALQAQGTVFSVKGGATIGFQQWNNSSSEALIRYHGIFAVESYRQDSPFALFAQTGYHVRGGATRIRGGTYTNQDGNLVSKSLLKH